MTRYLILATVRTLVFQMLLSGLMSQLLPNVARRRALVALFALIAGAGLDGATPDGWEYEYALGHPFWLYIFANAPVVLGVLVLLLFLTPARQTQDVL